MSREPEHYRANSDYSTGHRCQTPFAALTLPKKLREESTLARELVDHLIIIPLVSHPDLWKLKLLIRHDCDGKGHGLHFEGGGELGVFGNIAFDYLHPLLFGIGDKLLLDKSTQHLAGATTGRIEVYPYGLVIVFDDRFIIFICEFHAVSITQIDFTIKYP